MCDEELELMKICTNCNQFFPLNEYQFKKGVCLLDDGLEPYLDDILEMRDLSPIKDLIESKLIDDDQESCEKFDPVEFDPSETIDIDDVDDDIIDKIRGETDPQVIISKILERDPLQMVRFVPMDVHKANLENPDKSVKEEALKQIANFATLNNLEAREIFYEYYENLPPAETLEDAHHRIDMLQRTKGISDEERYARLLLKELYRTESNNTTRGLISEVFKILSFVPFKYIKEDLEDMLNDKRFSYRLKQKMKVIFNRHYY
jgi:hypothetical protein